MFQELEGILAHSKKLTVTIFQGENGKMKVCVAPGLTDSKEGALNHPLALAGTPLELDEGFADALQKFTAKRNSLIEQVAATTAILDNAKATQEKKAVSSLKGKSATAKSSTSSDNDDADNDKDDLGEGNEGGSKKPETKVDASPAWPVVASSGTDLGSLLL